MPQVTFLASTGAVYRADLADGENLMRGAIRAGVNGLSGSCGGQCRCSSCHVMVDPAWAGRVGDPPTDSEAELLDQTAVPAGRTSRLACQIVVGAQLDGLVIHIPERQA